MSVFISLHCSAGLMSVFISPLSPFSSVSDHRIRMGSRGRDGGVKTRFLTLKLMQRAPDAPVDPAKFGGECSLCLSLSLSLYVSLSRWLSLFLFLSLPVSSVCLSPALCVIVPFTLPCHCLQLL